LYIFSIAASMNPTLIFTGYLEWHYGKAYSDILVVWTNFFWFVLHFFSIATLAKTLFSPWKRLHEEYRKGFHPEDFFSSLAVNILMRIVGAIVRLVIIIIGLIMLLLIALGGMLFLLFWTIAPAGVVISVLAGLALLG